MPTALPQHRRNFFVVTGGPGAGKTTLLERLSKDGFAIAPEAGRSIIRAQRAIGGPALPDQNPALFAELMLAWDLRSFESADPSKFTFFDRGIPDTVGYLRLSSLPVPLHLPRAAESFRYSETVFILPPWPEIFSTDSERKQTLDEAERTYEAMRATYLELGYRLVCVPRLSVDERCEFVLNCARG